MSGAVARVELARRLLGSSARAPLGAVTLADHQRAAACRLSALLQLHGGALLADDVGLGKTFVALAVARRYARRLVIAPAALRGMWIEAAARAGVAIETASYEQLSRAGRPDVEADVVILDEAHHARNAHARRYDALVTLTADAHTLLISATPVPNRRSELQALFALFLGEHAHEMSAGAMAHLIVRRTARMLPTARLPAVMRPRWIEATDDSDCLSALDALPPPVAPAGGGGADALLRLNLIKQWASSRAALTAGLRRRVARSSAMHDALAAGRLPSARELSAWSFDGDALQLGFAELMASTDVGSDAAASLREALAVHTAAVLSLLAQLRRSDDPDDTRAARLIELRHEFPGEPVLAFTSYAETATAYWRRIRHFDGTGLLTARGGCIASGQIGRHELLARFAPAGQRRAQPRAIESVTLLVTTDLLSEGVDLRDATVIVHLDLPWSPARLEQRVGRSRRLGSDAGAIHVLAMRPPAPVEQVLALERRLRSKAMLAATMVGLTGEVLPPRAHAVAGEDGGNVNGRQSEAETLSSAIDVIASWLDHEAEGDSAPPLRRRDDGGAGRRDATLAATVPSSVGGWLALVRVAGSLRLLRDGDDAGGDSNPVLRAVRAASCASIAGPSAGTAIDPSTEQLVTQAVSAATVGVHRHAAAACLDTSTMGATARRLLRRVQVAVAVAPPDCRTRVASLAHAARAIITGRLSLGMERRLAALDRQHDDDATWLSAVVASAPRRRRGDSDGDDGVEVLIVFRTGAAQALSSLSDAELTQ